MDRRQFDALARFVSTRRSRRSALVTVLGGALLGRTPAAVLAKGNKKDSTHAKAQERPCYPGTRCTPGKGTNASGCDFSGSVALFQRDVRGSNLSGANFTAAQLAGANFKGVNLSRACLVGANLRGATIDASANLHQAVFCETIMPDGSRNDRDCAKGTRCCPTPPPICQPGQICPGNQCSARRGDQCSVFGFLFPTCCFGFECTPILTAPALTFCQVPCSQDATCQRFVGGNSRCEFDAALCPYMFSRCCSQP